MSAKRPSDQGLQTLIDVMSKYSENSVIQQKGCEALLELSSKNERTRIAVFERGIDVVVGAMAAHPDNQDVQRSASLLLGDAPGSQKSKAPRSSKEHRKEQDRALLQEDEDAMKPAVVDLVVEANLKEKEPYTRDANQESISVTALSVDATKEDEGEKEKVEDGEEEGEGAADAFRGRISPFAKDIDPDLEPEAFRDALRDNIYAFQGKSLGNQMQENYMQSLQPPEEKTKGRKRKKAATKIEYNLYGTRPRSAPAPKGEEKSSGSRVIVRRARKPDDSSRSW